MPEKRQKKTVERQDFSMCVHHCVTDVPNIKYGRSDPRKNKFFPRTGLSRGGEIFNETYLGQIFPLRYS